MKIETHSTLPPAEVIPGLWAPPRLTVTASDTPYDVVLDVVVEGGRFVCERLEARRLPESGSVNAQGLRRIPVAALIRDGVSQVAQEGERSAEGNTTITPMTWDAEDIRESGPTRRTLRVVAHIYRVAFAVGEQPTKAVAETLGIPRSTAGRWVQRAREAGYLATAEPGRAGG